MLVKAPARSHPFHIPVLGTGFSIDAPLKVACYGIASVVSIVDDGLIESMRKHHLTLNGEPYEPIPESDEDFRAKRITAYLNLLDRLVKTRTYALKQTPFIPGSEITRYFELLPDGELKGQYAKMLQMPEGTEKTALGNMLREQVRAGGIDVNIMTKLDRQAIRNGQEVSAYYSDATAALRGYANSTLDSAVVFSAGMNPRLFATLNDYPDFFADTAGYIRKRIILKVSDYRSALIQGILLAKKGLWVSEFRIESGLNCGGHAFATKGHLMGPILDEFLNKRQELTEKLLTVYQQACEETGRNPGIISVAITVQGGIGTADEDHFIREYYQVDSIGWGTPFMLVPEVINLDEEHLKKLAAAGKKDVFLSQASPLGILFWNLKSSGSEVLRRLRIRQGHPGAVCRKGLLALNSEFAGRPLCAASRTFQRQMLEKLKLKHLPGKTFRRLKANIQAKACICRDLAVSITKKIGLDPDGKTAVTPGPNIVNFSRIVGLNEMVAHIYGKINLITSKKRPHVFLRELELYRDYLRAEIDNKTLGISQQGKKYFIEFHSNLQAGIQYYRELSDSVFIEGRDEFRKRLARLQNDLKKYLPRIEHLTE